VIENFYRIAFNFILSSTDQQRLVPHKGKVLRIKTLSPLTLNYLEIGDTVELKARCLEDDTLNIKMEMRTLLSCMLGLRHFKEEDFSGNDQEFKRDLILFFGDIGMFQAITSLLKSKMNLECPDKLISFLMEDKNAKKIEEVLRSLSCVNQEIVRSREEFLGRISRQDMQLEILKIKLDEVNKNQRLFVYIFAMISLVQSATLILETL